MPLDRIVILPLMGVPWAPRAGAEARVLKPSQDVGLVVVCLLAVLAAMAILLHRRRRRAAAGDSVVERATPEVQADAPPPEPERATAPAPRPRASETLLLVEENQQLRTVMAEILRFEGYTVLRAGNAAEALLAAQGYTGRIHLLVTSLALPGMHGRALASRLESVRPGLKVLYLGMAQGPDDPRQDAAPEATLSKPLTRLRLLTAVRNLLSATAEQPPARSTAPDSGSVRTRLEQKVVGQPGAIQSIAAYLEMYEAGLAPAGRPAGVFLLLGPTGTGKTSTVEALAEALHGNPRSYVRVDCGEFQQDHELAKLTGAPPGYLGHRETRPILTQTSLAAAASERSDLSLVLFDEIEKAAPALTHLLLGILDKGMLRLGDNTTVQFDHSFIFLTSNLGAREMSSQIHPSFGFRRVQPAEGAELASKLHNVALAAVQKRWSPEFMNRMDVVITYQPLDLNALAAIVDQQIAALQEHVNQRLGSGGFTLEVPVESRHFLLRKGSSEEYGARELKRVLHRYLTQPLAGLVAKGQIQANARVSAELAEDQDRLVIRALDPPAGVGSRRATALVADGNADVRLLLEQVFSQASWSTLRAGSAAEALEMAARQPPHLALVEYVLPDGDGVALGKQLQRQGSGMSVVILAGTRLPATAQTACEAAGFPILLKPFRCSDVLRLISPPAWFETVGYPR